MKKLSLVLAVVFVATIFVAVGWAHNHGVDISPRKALDIALAHAGTDRDNAMDISVELETWHNQIVYDIELEFAGFEYHYHISAKDGTILRHHKESCD